MDSGRTKFFLQPNPRKDASILSIWFFCWANDLMRKGYKKELELGDLYQVLDEDRSDNIGNKLEEALKNELNTCKQDRKGNEKTSEYTSPQLLKMLIRVFGTYLIIPGILCFIEECGVQIMLAWFMGQLISYFNNDNTSTLMAWIYVFGIVLTSACYNIIHHQGWFKLQTLGMRLRVSLSSVIYRKALRLSYQSVSKYTIGKIVNLITNDVNKLDLSLYFFHYIWVTPIQFLMVLYLTWQLIGVISLTGGAILILFILFQPWISKRIYYLRGETAKKTDERITLMNEIINGIQLIKMYAWEKSFSDIIANIRKDEMGKIRSNYYVQTLNYTMFGVFTPLVLCFILLIWVWNQEIVTPEIAFLTLSWYNLVKVSSVRFFTNALSFGSQAMKSIKRIEFFLSLEEYDETQVDSVEKTRPNYFDDNKDHGYVMPSGKFVLARNISAKWNQADCFDAVKDLAFQIKQGSCFGICGSVGSGKSSLLQTLLGNLVVQSGELDINGKVSYASQDPWVFDGTIRQNILFGREMDINRYDKVIKLCCMGPDLASFKFGSNQLVGDRGITLSGGQKSRLNLARSLYTNGDIYLLDDPLSAVDANVANEIFQKCIRQHLKEKIVILATHQLQFLKDVDKIIVLDKGKIVEFGSYNELRTNSNGKLFSMLKEVSGKARFCNENSTPTNSLKFEITTKEYQEEHNVEKTTQISNGVNYGSVINMNRKELKKVGSVSTDLYWKYLKAGASPVGILALIVSTLLSYGLYRFVDAWLGLWSSQEIIHELQCLKSDFGNCSHEISQSHNEDLDSNEFDRINYYYMSVYGSSVIIMIVTTFFMRCNFFRICNTSSNNLHNKMISRIICAPMKFFHDNPSGRVLSRFSNDMGRIDESLPTSMVYVYDIMFKVLGIISIVIYKIWWMVGPTIIIAAVFKFLRKYYLKSSTAIKRIEGAAKSPLVSQLTSSLSGLTTIRCCKAERKLIQEFDELQDQHSSAWFCYLSTSRLLAVYCDWISFFYLCLCTFPFVIAGKENVEPSDVGLVISTILLLTRMLQFGIRESAQMENLMTSVERVMEYGEITTEQESDYCSKFSGPYTSSTVSLSDNCKVIKNGIIEFRNVFLRYSDEYGYVLQNISFKTGKEEKVGVIGRTGAGKSSLISALFRLVEPEGDILIDGVSIKEMTLEHLRNLMSIIPQDPVLFTGTLRMNLDPFNVCSERQLWNALRLSNLTDYVLTLPKGLEHIFSAGGDNLSVGQRQLICLARALLRQTKILVLDEATANVDLKTDDFIQKTIRKEFKDCTIITIAHRLNTIIDYDKILVLSGGKVVQFDSPETLMKDKETLFYSMLQNSGLVSS